MGISRKEALDYFQSNDLIGIGMEADAIRRHIHPEGVVTYTLDGQIDYSNPANNTTYDLIIESTSHIAANSGTAIILQGEVTPIHTIPWFKGLFRTVKQQFPTLHLHSLSATEILAIAKQSGSTIEDTLAHLQDAGLDSISSNDAGILDNAVQRQITAEDWLTVHRTAHTQGMQTTATMTFGAGETIEHRLNHLEKIHQLQEETRGFISFTPLSFAPQSPSASGFEEATAVEYLKTLAISRMCLDDIENVQSNLETQGLKVVQVSLRFGANDAGSLLLAKGANAATEEQVRQVIRDAGFKPVQRGTLYRTMFLN
ncbi:MAG: dehypoxanthine futalosine cyclase [Edaphobacter sp.]